MEEKKDRDFRIGFLVLGTIMVGVGILFLAANFIPYLTVGKLWPLFMLIPVVIMITVGIQDRKKLSWVILPVVVLTFYCGYFLWLNFTSWGYAETTWPNFLIGLGLGFLGIYFTTQKWEFLAPALFLLILAAVFYGAIIENTLFVAVLLIAMGLGFIIKALMPKRKKPEAIEAVE